MAKTFRMKHMGDHITMPIDARGNVVYSEKEIDRINQAFNRIRISGNEMEQMIGLISAGNLFRQCAKELEGLAEHAGAMTLLKRVSTSIKTAAVRMANCVEARQMGAIISQTDNAKLTVSAEYVPAMVNIKLDDLLGLCNVAMEQCAWSCTCTRDESKDCYLRKVLETIPGVKDQAKENARKDATRCPYKGMEMEVGLDDAV